jgi:hypothetical protein
LRTTAVLFKGDRDQYFTPGYLVLDESRLRFFRTTNVILEACLRLLRLYKPKPRVEVKLAELRDLRIIKRPARIEFFTPTNLIELRTSTSHLRFGVANGEEWFGQLTAAQADAILRTQD